ncbi:hypothetical protein D1872_231020 [compost metagenome]
MHLNQGVRTGLVIVGIPFIFIKCEFGILAGVYFQAYGRARQFVGELEIRSDRNNRAGADIERKRLQIGFRLDRLAALDSFVAPIFVPFTGRQIDIAKLTDVMQLAGAGTVVHRRCDRRDKERRAEHKLIIDVVHTRIFPVIKSQRPKHRIALMRDRPRK